MSMTVAPELFTQRQLDLLRDAGIKLCLGHTSCDYEVATKFFQDSSHVMTHAFNGMRGIHHREPGPILAALEAGAYTELIADGHHVSPSAARLLNPDKVILVTDAMAATGQGDGHYALGSTEVEVHQGVARDSRGSLAGSTLLLHMAVTNYAKWTNNPEAALRAAITNPTDAYGLSATGLERGLILWDNTMGMVRNL
jgi:N-acetylglucosamine-6-phosphate deacetylase